MNSASMTRRAFLASATTTAMMAGGAIRVNAAQVVPRKLSPNDKLNIAGVGVGGMGRANLRACQTENIVALCDVDDVRAAGTYAEFPDARRYKDYRKLFDAEANNIDAVIVATPDHNHAVVAMAAMRLGKHVYCQKPLAHSVYEVRQLTEAARKYGVQTQMGNQGHSSDTIRQCREWVADDAIGPVREVYAWSDRPVGGDPWSTFPVRERPEDTPPVPDTLDWDQWLGPAPYRPYHPAYCPESWRGWCDFGTGPLGDMGCHILDPAFWALNLGAPESVEATTTHWEKEVSDETYPRACIVRYQFPAHDGMPPVSLTWFDGRLKPPTPRDFGPENAMDSNGALFIGEKGSIQHGSHGAGRLRLLPTTLAESYQQPAQTIPRVENEAHEQDWIRACKDGRPASSSFDYGGPLTEMVLLGVIAIRMKDRKLLWDSENLRITNDDEANELVNPAYRDGWTL